MQRKTKVSDGYTKIINKKHAKQVALVSGSDRNQSTETALTVVSMPNGQELDCPPCYNATF